MFGLPGLIAYLAAAGFLINRSLQAVKNPRPLLVGFGAAVIGYLVQQQFLFPIAEIDILFWLFAGIVVAGTGPMRRVAKPPVLVGIVLGSMAVVALIGGTLCLAGVLVATLRLR